MADASASASAPVSPAERCVVCMDDFTRDGEKQRVDAPSGVCTHAACASCVGKIVMDTYYDAKLPSCPTCRAAWTWARTAAAPPALVAAREAYLPPMCAHTFVALSQPPHAVLAMAHDAQWAGLSATLMPHIMHAPPLPEAVEDGDTLDGIQRDMLDELAFSVLNVMNRVAGLEAVASQLRAADSLLQRTHAAAMDGSVTPDAAAATATAVSDQVRALEGAGQRCYVILVRAICADVNASLAALRRAAARGMPLSGVHAAGMQLPRSLMAQSLKLHALWHDLHMFGCAHTRGACSLCGESEDQAPHSGGHHGHHGQGHGHAHTHAHTHDDGDEDEDEDEDDYVVDEDDEDDGGEASEGDEDVATYNLQQAEDGEATAPEDAM